MEEGEFCFYALERVFDLVVKNSCVHRNGSDTTCNVLVSPDVALVVTICVPREHLSLNAQKRAELVGWVDEEWSAGCVYAFLVKR